MKKKNKIIQTITAWKYPCGKVFWTRFPYNVDPDVLTGVYRTKKEALKEFCRCGGNCKPEKVKIIVMKEE